MRRKAVLKRKKIGYALLAVGLYAPLTLFTACGKKGDNDFMNDVITRDDFSSVYAAIGDKITLDMVTEKENGLAYANYDGKEYELGMDFLSMAMVYNATPVGAYQTATEVYNEWWRLFMQRWNYLAPEAPLYSNQYYDIYNAKIDKLQTNPYWSASDAIVGAKVVSGENAVVLGSSTELSGSFRNAAFGKSSAGAADLAIETLTSGYSTVVTDTGGVFQWAGADILAWHTQADNADGTKTYTVKIADDLVFSNGAPITAENYLVSLLAGSSKVMKQAGGSDAAGLTIVGYENFLAYEGTLHTYVSWRSCI